MKIWLAVLGEPTALDGSNPRYLRTAIIAKILASRGHNITFWTSTMNHVKKTQRFNKTECVNSSDLSWVYLYGMPYRKNISLGRILHNITSAKSFDKVANDYSAPDVIVCSCPTIELTYAMAAFAKKENIPIIIDIRDFWPDIFLERLPKIIHPFIKPFINSQNSKLSFAIESSSAVTGISDQSIDWAISKSKRKRHKDDIAFPLAYDATQPNIKDIETSELFWDELGITKDKVIFSFFGNLSSRYELEAVINAAKNIPESLRSKIKIVLCGDGEMHSHLCTASKDLTHVCLAGWVEKPQIWTLLQRSTAGLLPYPSSLDFTRAYPNKIGEYLSAGLPIISSIKGAPKELIEKEKCGYHYNNNNHHELSKIIINICNNTQENDALRANCKGLYNKLFNSTIVYKNYCDHIEKIAK